MEYLTDGEVKRIQQEFRIPVDSLAPGTYWIVSLDRESLMPTDLELRQIRSFCEFNVRTRHHDRLLIDDILTKPLAIESGCSTIVFIKGINSDPDTQNQWRYRRSHWRGESGPLYVPETATRLGLVEVMDRIEMTLSEPWEEWKRGNPETFPSTTTTAPH